MNGPEVNNHAVVLSGGGAYGAYEVGVMKALFRGESPATEWTPLNALVFSGTSVGSYNAAVMTSQPGTHAADTVSYLEDAWLHRIADAPEHCGNGVYRFRANALNFFDPGCVTEHPLEPFTDLVEDTAFFAQDWLNRALGFANSDASIGRRITEAIDLSTLISTDPFVQMLEDTVDLEGIRRSEKLLRVATTNMDSGELKLFNNEEFSDLNGHKIIMASSAVPGFFPPVAIDKGIYLDGGITMNTPLRPAVRAGANILHVIYMDPDVKTIPVERFHSTLNVLDRVIVVTFASTINRDVELATNINKGLTLLEKVKGRRDLFGKRCRGDRLASAERADEESFIQVADQIQKRIGTGERYRKITIHRYHPREDLGGVLGLLNFGYDKTLSLIARGYEDAKSHDCEENGCALPEGVRRPDREIEEYEYE